MAMTNQQKLEKRTNELDAIAQEMGFKTWAVFSTEIKNSYQKGRVHIDRRRHGNGEWLHIRWIGVQAAQLPAQEGETK